MLPGLDQEDTDLDLMPDVSGNGSSTASHIRSMSEAGFTFIASMLTITYVVGSFINGLCLFVFAKNKRLRSPTNIFVIALNLCDFLMCFVAIPLTMTSAWAHRWLWGDAMAVGEGFLVYFLGLSSMYILMAIAVDRYIAISKPLLGAKITKKTAMISCGLCYLGGFLWSALPLIGWNKYQLEGAGISSSVVWESREPSYTSYIYTIFFTCLVIPLCVMTYSYYGVLRTLRTLNQNSVWDMNSRVAKKNLAIERKMFKTTVLILAAFLLCWLPYAIVSFVAAFAGHHVLPALLATVPPIFAKTQGLFDPIIYIATNAQMRTVIFSMLPCDGLRGYLMNDDKDKDEEGESEESDVGDAEGGDGKKRNRKSGKSVAPSAPSNLAEKGKSGVNKKSNPSGTSVKKKGGGKKNAVHALAVEPSEDGVSEVSHLDVALTPVQTINIPAPGEGGGGGEVADRASIDNRGDGADKNLQTEIASAEGHDGAAP